MINQENYKDAGDRLDRIATTIKELRAYGSDEARAKRAIAHERLILEGVSRKRDPFPWAVTQLRLASALTIVAERAHDVPQLRRAAYRFEKARLIFDGLGKKDFVQTCQDLLGVIKRLLVKFGDGSDGPLDLTTVTRGDYLEPARQRYADDLADRLRQGADEIDHDAALRSVEVLRQSREAEELRAKALITEREEVQQQRDEIETVGLDDRDPVRQRTAALREIKRENPIQANRELSEDDHAEAQPVEAPKIKAIIDRADNVVVAYLISKGIDGDLVLQRIRDAPNVDWETRNKWAERDIQAFAKSNNVSEKDARQVYERGFRDASRIYAKARDDIRDVKRGPELSRSQSSALGQSRSRQSSLGYPKSRSQSRGRDEGISL